MTDLYVEGPDVLRLLSDLGVNTFANFAVEQGEAVRRVQPRRLRHRRRASCSSSTRTGSRSSGAPRPTTGSSTTPRPAATTSRSSATSAPRSTRPGGASSTASRCRGRRRCRCSRRRRGAAARDQVLQHGRADSRRPPRPRAPPRHVRRARNGALRAVGGRRRRPRRHRRGRPRVRTAHRSASRVYATNTLESGWIPCPLPAVFTGEQMKRTASGCRRTATRPPARSAAASPPTTSATTT